jgi:hypothetical protein
MYCIFEELKVVFCKLCRIIQIGEWVYMAFRVIKQVVNEKVKEYYQCNLSLLISFNTKQMTTCLLFFSKPTCYLIKKLSW